LVARGDRQRPDIDFKDIYAPVVNYNTLRAMFAVAAVNDYDLDQMDAVTAFLNGSLAEELYLHIPEGFESKPGFVIRLRRSLYGLRQPPRVWNDLLHNFLTDQSLRQSDVDTCLYYICNNYVRPYLAKSATDSIGWVPGYVYTRSSKFW
jgi:hypothetical protein